MLSYINLYKGHHRGDYFEIYLIFTKLFADIKMYANDNHSHNEILVIAGSYNEYLNWRKENPDIRSCKYVERVEDLQGIHGFLADIVLHGNYQNNPIYHSALMRSLLAERASPFHAYVR